MSRLLKATQTGPAPVKVSTMDDSICQPYTYEDPSADSNLCTIIKPDSRVYIVESQYSLEALAEWDSKHARLQRKLRPNGRYALPKNKGEFKPVEVITLGSRKMIGAKQFAGCQPRLARDEKCNYIWALQPGVRIVPVKDVVIIERSCSALLGGPRYKAILPHEVYLARQDEFLNPGKKNGITRVPSRASVGGAGPGATRPPASRKNSIQA